MTTCAARGADERVEVTLEYGFSQYGSAASAIDFIHPSDPDKPACAAFIHPVLRS